MKEELNHITREIIGAALEVHRELGPGLLESVYQSCMIIELMERNLAVEAEVPVKIRYKGREIAADPLRIDLVADESVVVELKSVEEVKPVHKKQLLTYLRLSDKPLGLLINFNEVILKEGITRIAN